MPTVDGALREYISTLSYLTRLMDIAMFVLGCKIAHVMKFGTLEMPIHYNIALVIAILLTLIIFPMSKIYRSWRGKTLYHQAKVLTTCMVVVMVTMIVLAFITKFSTNFSREWLLTWFSLTLTGILMYRLALYYILGIMREKGLNHKKLIIVGAGLFGQSIANTLRAQKWAGYDVVGYLDDDPALLNKTIDGVPCLGSIDDTAKIVENNNIDELVIALPLKVSDRIKDILHLLRHTTITVRYAPNIFELRLVNYSVVRFAGLPVLNLMETPLYGVHLHLKELQDKLLASLFLLVTSPIFIAIAIAVKLSSPGPIFYRQERVSWNGKTFDMLKFRSMPVNTEHKSGPQWANKEESRATRVGAFLRKTSLDELPQFINVLMGDMSIVGPRPERPVFVDEFKDQIPHYMKKHMMKAGITGWAQINGWRGDTNLEKRIEYDLYYIENWSLMMDVKIMFLTVFKGFVHKNAY